MDKENVVYFTIEYYLAVKINYIPKFKVKYIALENHPE